MHFRTCPAVVTLLLALLAPCASRADALYTISVLPAGFNPSDINNAGQMAGVVYAGNAGPHAAILANGIVTDLGDLGASWSFASAINEAGAVTGNFDTADGAGHAFFYQNGVVRDIGAAYALGLNAAGDVVGQTYDATGASGFLYHAGTMTDLGHLGAGTTSLAAAINDQGQIVGESDIDAALHAPSHPYLYDHGVLHDLGTLAGREVNSAVAINNAGQVAGYSESANGGMHAFFYEHGVMTDLGSFGGLDVTIGGMNQLGQVVGTGNTWDGPDIPFISASGALVDLNTLIDATLGWAITSALDINDHGQIIANACRDGLCSAIRLDPAGVVPEPGAAVLMAAGMATLGVVRRRPRSRRWLQRCIATLALLPALLPALLLPLQSQAAPLYTVSLLPTDFAPWDIDNSGRMAGYFTDTAGATHAGLYDNGVITDLGALGAGNDPRAINAAGMVTGSFVTNGQAHAFLYRDGQFTDIGAGTIGVGINARGDVVGQKLTDGVYTGFVYRHGTLTALDNLAAGTVGLARDINDHGQIVGESNLDGDLHSPFHPVLYEHGNTVDLGTLAGREINGAQVINNAGQIAGYSEGPGGAMHAFFYDNGTLLDAGTFGGLDLNVTDINEHGIFVGRSAGNPDPNAGFVVRDGAIVDLSTLIDPALGWQIVEAWAINDAGQILASACQGTDCTRVRLDLASAVPEPDAALLLIAGLLLPACCCWQCCCGQVRGDAGISPCLPCPGGHDEHSNSVIYPVAAAPARIVPE